VSDDKPKDKTRLSLKDGDIVSSRVYGRRIVLRSLGATLLGAGAAVAGVRPASADPIVGDADRHTNVVNPDPAADQDREAPPPPPSDSKDSDQTTTEDAKDSDVTTAADPKVHAQSPDSDGSLRDSKDSDASTTADQDAD
jgi:hypothetical protein